MLNESNHLSLFDSHTSLRIHSEISRRSYALFDSQIWSMLDCAGQFYCFKNFFYFVKSRHFPMSLEKRGFLIQWKSKVIILKAWVSRSNSFTCEYTWVCSVNSHSCPGQLGLRFTSNFYVLFSLCILSDICSRCKSRRTCTWDDCRAVRARLLFWVLLLFKVSLFCFIA